MKSRETVFMGLVLAIGFGMGMYLDIAKHITWPLLYFNMGLITGVIAFVVSLKDGRG